jgi:hypothetical protein
MIKPNDKYSLDNKDEGPPLPDTVEETTALIEQFYETSFQHTLQAARLIRAAEALRKHAAELSIKDAANG